MVCNLIPVIVEDFESFQQQEGLLVGPLVPIDVTRMVQGLDPGEAGTRVANDESSFVEAIRAEGYIGLRTRSNRNRINEDVPEKLPSTNINPFVEGSSLSSRMHG